MPKQYDFSPIGRKRGRRRRRGKRQGAVVHAITFTRTAELWQAIEFVESNRLKNYPHNVRARMLAIVGWREARHPFDHIR